MLSLSLGQQVGFWKIEEFTHARTKSGKKIRRARCRCKCGSVKTVPLYSLKIGESTSCGCNRVAKMVASSIKHGRTKSKLHQVWMGMRSRCNNKRNVGYPRYGGRGISVCRAWDDFAVFAQDVGEPPTPKHTLERLNVDGNYEPGNVTWATSKEQSRNKSNTIWVELDGVTMCLKDAADLRGLKYATVLDRMRRRGWSADDALNVAPITQNGRELYREVVFLLDRLREFENENLTEDLARDWFGYVRPSMARLTSLTSDREDPSMQRGR